MVIKATSSSLGNINDGQSVICLLQSKSWRNCNNICQQYIFHLICAAEWKTLHSCNRREPNLWNDQFSAIFFSESNFPQNKHLAVWLSIPRLYRTWGEFFCPSDSSDLVLFCGWDTRKTVSEDSFFLALHFASFLYGVADHRMLIDLFNFCNHWFHFLFFKDPQHPS